MMRFPPLQAFPDDEPNARAEHVGTAARPQRSLWSRGVSGTFHQQGALCRAASWRNGAATPVGRQGGLVQRGSASTRLVQPRCLSPLAPQVTNLAAGSKVGAGRVQNRGGARGPTVEPPGEHAARQDTGTCGTLLRSRSSEMRQMRRSVRVSATTGRVSYGFLRINLVCGRRTPLCTAPTSAPRRIVYAAAPRPDCRAAPSNGASSARLARPIRVEQRSLQVLRSSRGSRAALSASGKHVYNEATAAQFELSASAATY